MAPNVASGNITDGRRNLEHMIGKLLSKQSHVIYSRCLTFNKPIIVIKKYPDINVKFSESFEYLLIKCKKSCM